MLASPAAAQEPYVAPERVLLRTSLGDLVLALYPREAPRHVERILRLVELGVYDTTCFYRIDPTYVQVSVAEDRVRPLTAAQSAAIRPIPGELNGLQHRYGRLSMARPADDPDGALTSFIVLLDAAPHLDRQYTVFGHVERGLGVLEAIALVERDDQGRPRQRVEIEEARVLAPGELDRIALRAPLRPVQVERSTSPGLAFAAAGALVLLGLVLFLAADRLSPRSVAAVALLHVLVGAFFLFMVLVPLSQQHEWLAVFLFAAALGLFKLMGRFEAQPAPPPRPGPPKLPSGGPARSAQPAPTPEHAKPSSPEPAEPPPDGPAPPEPAPAHGEPPKLPEGIEAV